MGSSIRIGSIFGIRLTLDWSFAFVFVLVVFSLGAGVFPDWHPDWGAGLVWGVALVTAGLFFASVLIHELSHALVGRHFGMEIRSITLFLLGGMANLETEPDSPKAEALMAFVGPVTSIVLGVVCLFVLQLFVPTGAGVADTIAMLRGMGPIATVLAWLGPINILIGIFNLLPGFPLDGGRLLRALLWVVSKDLRVATRWASRIGQALGGLMAVLGIAMAFGLTLPLFGTGLMGGLWLAFIGWFLSSAAAASYRQVVIKALLEGVAVSRLMRRETPQAVGAGASVSDIVYEHLIQSGDAVVVVDEGGQLLGLVTSKEVMKVPRSEWNTTLARRIVVPLSAVPSVRPDEDAFTALQRIGRLDADALVVLEQGRLAGMLRRQDLMRWLELQSQDQLGPTSGVWGPERPSLSR